MNFFQSIVAMQVAGGWKINITKEKEDKLVVSVLYYDDAIGDEARKKLPPMLLKGTAAELDGGFFAAIEQPVKETAALFTNMEQYLKEREQAKLQSQKEKDSTVKVNKPQSEKDKKYEAAMKLADELDAKGKYRDAWMKVPDASLYPEHADTIRERKTALAKKFAPEMFDTPSTEIPVISQAETEETETDEMETDEEEMEADEENNIDEPEND